MSRRAISGVVLAFVLSIFMQGGAGVQAAAVQETEIACIQTQEMEGKQLVPLGNAVGIKLFSDGVLVVGLSSIDTVTGPASPGKTSGLKVGDLITHINEQEVNTIEQVQEILKKEQGNPLTLQVNRKDSSLQLSAQALQNSAGDYQLGVWLRDSMAGIGTMTFYDPESGMFAALGHGINDVDTAMRMPLESGSIMEATVSEVKKGTAGEPGELHGVFDLTEDMGTLFVNTDQGIFGQIEPENVIAPMEPVEIAAPQEVKKGKATIRSNISGNEVLEYEIEILDIDTTENTRNMMIQVTDPRLLETTGGIVQGMSGSPILQDGKIVGAVTHVLVNDPTRGYGIFIENMLEAVGNSSE